MERMHKVKVGYREIEVTVSQVSKEVCIATGKFGLDMIETTEPSEIAALKRWQEAAEAMASYERSLESSGSRGTLH